MDLSFPPFDRADELVAWPGDLAALMVGVAARQGASRTAIAQALLHTEQAAARAGTGSFNPAVASLLATAGHDGGPVAQPVNDPFTVAGQGIFNACRHNDDIEFKPGTGAPIEDQ